jgi:hypothetical protein
VSGDREARRALWVILGSVIVAGLLVISYVLQKLWWSWRIEHWG